MDATFVARIAHEADRTFLATQGDLTRKTWFAIDAWERDSAIRGVKAVQAAPTLSPQAHHAVWLIAKDDEGWTYGARFDLGTRRDPKMVRWDKLSLTDRRRDALFVAVVRALITQP